VSWNYLSYFQVFQNFR